MENEDCLDIIKSLQELSDLNKLIEFTSKGPYSSEVLDNGQVLIKDKDGNLVMALGQYWIEK